MSIPDRITSIDRETSNTIMLVTDPYHDYNLGAVGYPDGSAILSAVQRRYARKTIANPFNLTVGESWAFHIYATPLHFVRAMPTGNLSGNVLVTNANPDVEQGPLNIQFFHYDNTGAIKDSQTVALGSSSPYTNSNMSQVRTVSFGYELHNTTADINRSGSLTVYRTPVNYHQVNMYTKQGAVFRPFGCLHLNSIPHSIETATNYPNTRTWEASKGLYSVCLPDPNNTFSNSVPSNIMLKSGTSANGYTYMYHDPFETEATIATHSPLCCTGVWSSKYSTDQTFTLDFRQILEILPSSNDPVDLSFASTCKPRDRLFLKLYKQMYTEIPPGVPVSMNAAGDWVRSIIKIAKTVLPSLGAMPGIVGNVAKVATPVVHAISTLTSKPDVSNRTVTNKQLKAALKQPTRKPAKQKVPNSKLKRARR